MEIIRAKTMGFCMGVRLAMKSVEDLLVSDIPRPIHIFGPLIHNERVLERLREQGIGRIDSVEEFTDGSVVLRTHGVRPQDKQHLEELGAHIVDLTCPRVLKSQHIVSEAAGKGMQVILVGDRNHGEIIAIEGYAPGSPIIRTGEEAETVQMDERVLVVGQTTLLRREYMEIGDILKKRNPDAEIAMTLCPATEQRQQALEDLAGLVEGILVVGGRNSANTGRLYQKARETGLPSWHIEGAEDLPTDVFTSSRIGITAGASTPDWIVEEVEQALTENRINI